MAAINTALLMTDRRAEARPNHIEASKSGHADELPRNLIETYATNEVASKASHILKASANARVRSANIALKRASSFS